MSLQLLLLALLSQPLGSPSPSPPTLDLPVQSAQAARGSEFARTIDSLKPAQREAAIQEQILSGNLPPFLRTLKAIQGEATGPSGDKHSGTYFVTPDYLAVGDDADFFRQPMRPQTARAIARASHASLLTTKMSNDIFAKADLKLPPRPLTKDRDAARTFYEHHQIIEQQRKGTALGLLVAGIKKDVVLSNRLLERPGRVAIYGWHHPDGKPIQPLYIGHSDWHVDYSHAVRLVSRHMIVDGQPRDLFEVLKDPELAALVSSEGPIHADEQYVNN
jgi:hypothetical protein